MIASLSYAAHDTLTVQSSSRVTHLGARRGSASQLVVTMCFKQGMCKFFNIKMCFKWLPNTFTIALRRCVMLIL